MWDQPSDDVHTEGGPAEALAAVHRLRDRLAVRTSEPIPPTREQVIAHLRSLSAEGLLELLREARVCVRWEECDGGDPDHDVDAVQSYLRGVDRRIIADALYSHALRCWSWRLHVSTDSIVAGYGRPDLASAKVAAEDAAIAAGYRVPWRQP